jgi:hypothetical protein
MFTPQQISKIIDSGNTALAASGEPDVETILNMAAIQFEKIYELKSKTVALTLACAHAPRPCTYHTQMLHAAIKKGYKQIVIYLINTLCASDYELKLALDNRQYEIASLLLTRLDRIFTFYYTPLRDDVDYVKFFVERGIVFSNTAHITIFTKGFYNIVKYLTEQGTIFEEDYVRIAACKGYLNIVKYLIENTVHNCDLKQLLLSAVTSDNIQLVQYLIDAGVSVINNYYMHNSLFSRNNDILRLLVKLGSRDYTDRTMEKAIYDNNIEAVEILLQQEGSGYVLSQAKSFS